MTDDECMAYDQGLRNAGRCLASRPSARSYRYDRAGPQRKGVHQGRPFHRRRRVLGWVLFNYAADLNDAIQVASQMPPASLGSIEVRPVRELTSTSGERRRL